MVKPYRWLRRLLIALAVILILLTTAWFALPHLLDRVYYQGPRSSHFDGERFFNPDGERGTGGSQRGGIGTLLRFATAQDRAPWPKSVPVTPTRPDARVGTPCPKLCPDAPLRVTWIGHSTVLIQTQGLNILTDPIWSERASPFSFIGPKRVREPGVRFEDLPKIDVVLVSHNHYDHFDVATLKRLWQRDHPKIITGLGNDTLLKDAGIPSIARDWGDHVSVRPDIEVVLERVHHWDSRWMYDRNRALWTGFAVRTPGGSIFFAGDTGPGNNSWVEDAAKDGPYRFAMIPIGAFKPREMMSGNHIGPVEAVYAFEHIHTQSALGIHWGTFQLSNERIDEPRQLLAETLAGKGIAAGRFRTTEVGQPWNVQ